MGTTTSRVSEATLAQRTLRNFNVENTILYRGDKQQSKEIDWYSQYDDNRECERVYPRMRKRWHCTETFHEWYYYKKDEYNSESYYSVWLAEGENEPWYFSSSGYGDKLGLCQFNIVSHVESLPMSSSIQIGQAMAFIIKPHSWQIDQSDFFDGADHKRIWDL